MKGKNGSPLFQNYSTREPFWLFFHSIVGFRIFLWWISIRITFVEFLMAKHIIFPLCKRPCTLRKKSWNNVDFYIDCSLLDGVHYELIHATRCTLSDFLVIHSTGYIVTCQRGGVSNKPLGLQAETRHRARDLLVRSQVDYLQKIWKEERTVHWTRFTKTGRTWHITVYW